MATRRSSDARLHFIPQPIKKKEAAYSSKPVLTVQNRRYEEAQKKASDLQAELETYKASKKIELEAAEAETEKQKRIVHHLRADNEKLAKQSMTSSNSQQSQQRIQQLEDQLRRINWEKENVEAKLNAEKQARAELITKLSQVNEANQSLSQQLQQQQHSRHQSTESQRIRDDNKDLQRRIDFLTHENDFLKNEQQPKEDNRPNSKQLDRLERALQESRKHCATLDEEKNRMAMELTILEGKGEKMNVLLEKSEWMNGVMTEQLNFCKTNAEMWQEQSKVLSEYLKNGGMQGPLPLPQQQQQLQLQQQQPQFQSYHHHPMSVYSFPTPGSSSLNSSRGRGGRDSSFNSPSSSQRNSTSSQRNSTSSQRHSTSSPTPEVIELEDVKQEHYF